MGHPPQATQSQQQLYYYFPELQALDPTPDMEMQTQRWMTAILIDDDDLTFGGKPLRDLHEEDRRRSSMGEAREPYEPS